MLLNGRGEPPGRVRGPQCLWRGVRAGSLQEAWLPRLAKLADAEGLPTANSIGITSKLGADLETQRRAPMELFQRLALFIWSTPAGREVPGCVQTTVPYDPTKCCSQDSCSAQRGCPTQQGTSQVGNAQGPRSPEGPVPADLQGI